MSSVWPSAQALRDEVMPWLPNCKVELVRDPSSNIGGLHAKAAEIRAETNKVRDVVFKVMAFNMALRREASEASWRYEQARNDALKVPHNNEILAKYKTKDEREAALQQIVAAEYKASIDTKARLEEWEMFLKMVNLVYYSLSNTRDDVNTQVSIIKQQMFNGEIKADAGLEKLGSVFDMLGEGARTLLQPPAPDSTEEAPQIPGGSGETSWDK